jgi:copper chaperone CopZ
MVIATLLRGGLLVIAGCGLLAAEKPVSNLTFFVGGIECAACVEVVRQSVAEVEGVANVELEQRLDSVARVTYDPARASAHQIAQGVMEAVQLHGRPYEPWLHLKVPDYAKGGNAAKVDAVMAKMKAWVDIAVMDEKTGEFLVHFKALKKDELKPGPQGWEPEVLEKALSRPAPEGLGLACEWVTEPY